MAVDLTDQIPHETGPKPPVTNPVPKLDDIDVEVGDLSPLAAERAADGTRSKLTAAPPPIPMRARRASTMPPPIPSRAARGSAAPRLSKVSLVEPKATPEMMASWQINPEAPLSETAEPVRPSAPPIPVAVKAPVSALPTTIELVRAPEVVKPEVETPLVTGNAPSVVTASSTALPVVQQEIIPSPRESRVTQLPTSQPGADVADLPVWPTAPVAKTMGEVLAARASGTSLPPPTRDSSRLPAPRGRTTMPPPIPTVAAEPTPVAPKTLAAPSVLVAPEVVAKNVSALDGSDGWVFEDDYDERQVDGEVVPTTYFERTEPPPQTRSRFLIAAGGAAAALAVIVGIAMHGSSSTKPAPTATIAKPAVAQPEPPAIAATETAPAAVAPAPVVPAPVVPVVAPAAVPSVAAASLTTLPITSWPDGATVTLVDNGNATVLGRTPVSAALDRTHSYDVVLAVVGRPTIVKHVDFATMHELAVDLDPVVKDAAKEAVAAPKPHHVAPPANQIAVPNFDAPPAPAAHHHHHEEAVAAQVPAPAPVPAKPKQVALAAPAPAGTGTLMVSAKPPCEIVIDGKPTQLMTPQHAIALAPGAHAVTLINASNGIRKTIAVKVEAKKPTKLIQDFTKS
jgi:hypothetical protein